MKSSFFKQRFLEGAGQERERVGRQLATIYRNADGSRTNLRRLEPIGRRRPHYGLWFLLVAGVLGGLWWFQFGQPLVGKFGEEAVEVQLLAPMALKSGEMGTWRLVWTNRADVAIENVEVTLERGSALVVSEAQPAASDLRSAQWSLPDTPAGASSEITFRGLLWEKPGSEVVVGATVSFTPKKFAARFRRRVNATTRLAESVLRVSLDGPTQVVGGGEQSYTVRMENTAAAMVSGVKVVVTPPGAFTVSSSPSELAAVGGKFLASNLEIPSLGEKQFELKGSYVKNSVATSLLSSNDWRAEVFVRSVSSLDDVLAATSTLPVSVVEGDVLVTAVINGSPESGSIDLGGTLAIAVALTNRASSRLEDVALKVLVAAEPAEAVGLLDWQRANLHSGEKAEGAVLFSGSTLPALVAIAPKGSASVTLEVPIVRVIDPALSALRDISFRVESLATVGKAEGVVASREYASNVVTVKLNTDLSVSSGARYFTEENLAIGSGPLPPKVGETTKVRVMWKVRNTLHELAGLSLLGTLPSGIEWTGNARVAAGTIRYDAATREVRWTINRMPTSVLGLDADFELGFTPTATDVGHPVLLLKKTSFQSEDTLTRSMLKRQLEDLTSNLTGDPFGAGRGVVVR